MTRAVAAAVLLSAVLDAGAAAAAGAAADAAPHLVTLNVTVTLDRVNHRRSDVPAMTEGQIDHLRIVYDTDAINPVTHRVRLLNFQHYLGGHYVPANPDPVVMPMTDAWLDLGAEPYRMHLHVAVTHGHPILIDLDENTRRLTIHPQDNTDEILLSGPYLIDPNPVVRGRDAP